LYWYLSHLTSYPIELTLIEDQAVKPVLETPIGPLSRPGVQQIRLAEYGVRLKPGIEYRWFVAVVPDPDNRSKDVLAGGLIHRIEPSTDLAAQVAQIRPDYEVHAYAEAGIWYDALAAISHMIEAAPNDPILRRQRASLLEQVGLSDIADYDRRSGH
jgi:hypothetical protein